MNRNIAITIASLLILFSWLAYAYLAGTNPTPTALLLHPLVALLLALLIRSGWRATGGDAVWVVASLLLGLWVFLRLLNTLMPFVIGFALAYFVYLLADFFNTLVFQMSDIPLLQPNPDWKVGRWNQSWLTRLRMLRRTDSAGYALTPAAYGFLHFLERLRIAHRLNAGFRCRLWFSRFVLLALIVGILFFFIFHVGPQMGQQSADMQKGLNTFYGKAQDYVVTALDKLQRGEYTLPSWLPIPEFLREPVEKAMADMAPVVESYVTERIPNIAKRGSEFAATVLKGLSSVLSGAIGTVATSVLAIMVFAYAIGGFRQYMRKFVALFPAIFQTPLKRYLIEIDANMKAFLRGQLLVIALVGLLSMIVYGIIGVPFAVLVGLLAGICNAIPTFGPYIGGLFAVLALLMGLAGGSYTLAGFLAKLLMTIAAMFGVQMVDNSLISPRVMSSAVDVDPLLIMFSVIIGASLIGFWGVLLAIPGIVVIKSILHVSRLLRAERLQEQP